MQDGIAAARVLAIAPLLAACATTELHAVPDIQIIANPGISRSSARDTPRPTLKVMTLNLAHGRGDSFHQLLQGAGTTLGNLDAIASFLHEEEPDVVALQEADAASFWSGSMDHVNYLASNGPFTRSVHATHADGMGLSYGTALVSRLELHQPEAVTFNPSLAITPKGFIVSSITWPGNPCTEIDIVSLHLDFSSEETRRLQAAQLVETLSKRNRPLILMGDFNTDWKNPDSTLEFIASELGLNAYEPDKMNMHTFPLTSSRLDWILISPQLDFEVYGVLSDVLSDHRAVVAEISLNTSPISEGTGRNATERPGE